MNADALTYSATFKTQLPESQKAGYLWPLSTKLENLICLLEKTFRDTTEGLIIKYLGYYQGIKGP